MSSYNILFCDDEQDILESYKEFFEKEKSSKNEIFEKISESFFSTSFITDRDYPSVTTIVNECKEYNQTIDIAILDVNFSNIKGIEDFEDPDFSFEYLGVKISKYLCSEFSGIDIIFVSGNPGYIKNTYDFFSSNIQFIGKTNLDKQNEELTRIISEIIVKKQPKIDLIGKYEYLYKIDLPKNYYFGSKYSLELTNEKISNGKDPLTLNISINKSPFKTLAVLASLSCYDKDKNKIRESPKKLTSNDLEEILYKNNIDIQKLSETPERKRFIKNTFKALTGSEEPYCNFDDNKAMLIKYGERCQQTSCNNLLEEYKTCVMSLYTTNSKKRNISKDKLNPLRNELKKELEKRLKEKLESNIGFRWNYGQENEKEVSQECNCKSGDIDIIKNCLFPFCPYSLISSKKESEQGSSTFYWLSAKPTEKRFIEESQREFEE